MNIVYVAPFAFSPKATVSARMLPMATALVRRGHRVTILMPPYDNVADSGHAWTQEGVCLRNMRVRASNVAVQYVDLARQLQLTANELQPDVVHVFKPIGVGALTLQLPWPNRPRLVLDNDDWEGRGGWVDVNPYSPGQKAFMAWQEEWCLRRAPAVTCASEVLVQRTAGFRANARRNAGDIHLLPNGPDDAMRAQVAEAQSSRAQMRQQFGWRQPIVIYAGTIPLNHDLDIVVSALRQLPDVRWCIVATGDGIASLKQTIEAAGIGARVEWHGFMPHAQLVQRLVAADLAVYPYRDTNINRAKCSGKVMDYMAAGLPMVVSDVGMNRVYIEHARSGLLTPPGDAEACYAAIRDLLQSPETSATMGQAAQQRIWDVFGWDGRVAALEDIYRRDSTIHD